MKERCAKTDTLQQKILKIFKKGIDKSKKDDIIELQTTELSDGRGGSDKRTEVFLNGRKRSFEGEGMRA